MTAGISTELDESLSWAKKIRAKKVQSLVLSKKRFKTVEAARKWVTDHGYHARKVDETATSWRFRQFPPGQCEPGSFVTIRLTRGVAAVLCTRGGAGNG